MGLRFWYYARFRGGGASFPSLNLNEPRIVRGPDGMRLRSLFVCAGGVSLALGLLGLGAVPAGAQTTITLSFTDTSSGALTAVGEDDGAQTVRVVATAGSAPSSAVSVSVSVGASGSTATLGATNDYTRSSSSATVTIASGSTSGYAEVTITPNSDRVTENHETVKFTGTATGYTVTGADLSITDADRLVVLTLSDSAIPEAPGSSGSDEYNRTLTATLSGPTSTGNESSTSSTYSGTAVRFRPTMSPGTASYGYDLARSDINWSRQGQAVALWITISNGTVAATSSSFRITTYRNAVAEGNETFTMDTTSLTSGFQGVSAKGTITDADSAVTLTVSASSLSEGSDGSGLTVSASFGDGSTTSSVISSDTVVELSVAADTAQAADFTYSPGTPNSVTIPAGTLSSTASGTLSGLSIADDAVVEGPETLTVTGSNANGADGTASLTITDDDSAISLSVNPAGVAESATAQTVTVTAAFAGTSSSLTGATSVTVTVAGGGGADGATLGAAGDFTTDQTGNSFTVSIAAGSVSGNAAFDITAQADGAVEGTEKVDLSGSATVGGAAATVNGAELEIVDSIVPIALSFTNPSGGALTAVGEDDGAQTVRVVATASSAVSSSVAVTVTVGASGGTATSGAANDYTPGASTVTVTISAGAASGHAAVTITPNSDTVTEDHETIRFTGAASGFGYPVTGADLTITDADRTITLTWDNSAFTERDMTSGFATITTRTLTGTLSGATSTLSSAVNVRAVIEAGTAACCSTSTGDVDWMHYSASPSVDPTVAKYLNIAAGSVSGTITSLTVYINDDQVAEPTETFYITLTAPGFDVVKAEGTIADMDSTVALTLGSTSLAEGSDGSGVSVSAAFESPGGTAATSSSHSATEIALSVSADTAQAADFSYTPGDTVTIPANTVSSAVSGTLSGLRIINDGTIEASETLTVGGSHASLTVDTASLTIAADSTDIALSVNPVGVLESAAAQPVTVTATFSGGQTTTTNTDVTVTVASGGGTYGAVLGSPGDFTTDQTGDMFTVTIPAGSASGTTTINITAPADSAAEGIEKAALSGTATVNGAAATVVGAELSIADAEITLTAALLDPDNEPITTISEGASVEATVTVALPSGTNAASPLTVRVTVGQAGDSATPGSDYATVAPFNVVIPAGANDQSASFTLDATGEYDDSRYEGDEQLHVLYTPLDFAVNPIDPTALSIGDNDPIPVSPPSELPGPPKPPECEGRFCDEDDSVHQAGIETIAELGITLGCDADNPYRFCPRQVVSRSQMAAFLYRAVGHWTGRVPPTGRGVELSDVALDAWYRSYAQWAVSIGAFAAPGGEFDPAAEVARADMAIMMAAAFDLIPPGRTQPQPEGLFADMAGQDPAVVLAAEALHRAGVTRGCATEPLRYCPDQPVTRAQMATFIARALSIDPALPA